MKPALIFAFALLAVGGTARAQTQRWTNLPDQSCPTTCAVVTHNPTELEIRTGKFVQAPDRSWFPCDADDCSPVEHCDLTDGSDDDDAHRRGRCWYSAPQRDLEYYGNVFGSPKP